MKIINFSEFGQTPIDEDEKSALIPYLTTLDELNSWEHENIIEARQWVLSSKILNQHDIFDVTFLLKLHKKMFDKTWEWAGCFRKTGKNIGCEVYNIRSELKKLYDDAEFWVSNQTYSIEQIALIFHHRLVKIHLFPNGNGRHARLLSDCIIKKFAPQHKIEWQGTNFTSSQELRKCYIMALRKADSGDYTQLFGLFLENV
ncbi:MAG: mobile mystery protein B [Rickettsiales bacterium]|jgi:Fic-DOC domain mobile mystery protein B|nr:mobile mystery protein B [Rickettsiales bacterium]